MGAKKVLPLYKLINSGVMTGVNTLSSNPTKVENIDNIGLQVDWTGTPTGVFSVLCSIDGVNYHALTFNPVLAQPAGAAGGYIISVNQQPFEWLQVQYTNTSGVGVLNVWILGKDLN